jgi:hypothetical protein
MTALAAFERILARTPVSTSTEAPDEHAEQDAAEVRAALAPRPTLTAEQALLAIRAFEYPPMEGWPIDEDEEAVIAVLRAISGETGS